MASVLTEQEVWPRPAMARSPLPVNERGLTGVLFRSVCWRKEVKPNPSKSSSTLQHRRGDA